MIPGDVDGWSLVDIREEGVPKVGVPKVDDVIAGPRTAAAAAANLKKTKLFYKIMGLGQSAGMAF